MSRAILAVAILIAVPEIALAFTPRASSAEPAAGTLPTGQSVLVDDGTCPPGKIKQITGGDMRRGQARSRACVPRR